MLWDRKGRKVAELAPGGVWLKKAQACFDKRIKNDDNPYPSTVLAEEELNLGPIRGMRRAQETVYEGGAARESGQLYVTTYCLQQGDRAFVMSFYETDKTDEANRKLFDKVISTFRFK